MILEMRKGREEKEAPEGRVENKLPYATDQGLQEPLTRK